MTTARQTVRFAALAALLATTAACASAPQLPDIALPAMTMPPIGTTMTTSDGSVFRVTDHGWEGTTKETVRSASTKYVFARPWYMDDERLTYAHPTSDSMDELLPFKTGNSISNLISHAPDTAAIITGVKITEITTIHTKAGDFDTVHLQRHDWSTCSACAPRFDATMDMWFAPAISTIVKYSYRQSSLRVKTSSVDWEATSVINPN